ncbi:MAG: T9SS type A sorting domain-containing protein, partial [Ignavibacteriaceae bacterium]|nr:T9SS type A sorting domain-containing protein [Ignavibacteriaceae bacterium]
PSTTIKYNIPESGFTTIKVYNLLGSEVETLVNEMKQPGTYEVNFSSAVLPSGVYLYSMEVNNFRELKKLILLK